MTNKIHSSLHRNAIRTIYRFFFFFNGPRGHDMKDKDDRGKKETWGPEVGIWFN